MIKVSKIKPILKNVVVQPAPKEETSAGGIIIPENARKHPNRGKVVAVGNQATLTVGEEVIYGKEAGTPIEIDDEPYLILRESEILAVL
jgi:chaperonin GroES